ncbi:MAG: 30S ribosomal protein S6--L-glutamate ligase [Chloroflexi bacterium]|nr:30S ribosomal protein S6--L-glutamate ligase [Chloroflexota bacterium]
MKIGILSRNRELYSTRRLLEASESRGHETRVVDYLRCYMNITSTRPSIQFAGEALDFDAVIPRIGASRTFYGTAVVRQFEMMGVYSVNESQSISRSQDKLRSMQVLSRTDIGMPTTGFAHSTRDIDGLIDAVGGAPLIVKLLEGTQGVGVVLAETKKAAQSVISAFRQLTPNILIQEFIKESRGVDIRCFVIGRRVVAAMERRAPPGEFRSNIHQGGSAHAVELSPTERRTAVRAAGALGLRVAGVDIIRSERGPLVLEVNSSPGLEGIEAATGVDVADTIIRYVERNASPNRTRDRVKG